MCESMNIVYALIHCTCMWGCTLYVEVHVKVYIVHGMGVCRLYVGMHIIQWRWKVYNMGVYRLYVGIYIVRADCTLFKGV